MSIIKKRICLIVDNPIRDLQGLTLLCYFLAKNDFEAYLVPMATQQWDIALIKPDMVVVNYLRPANREFVRNYKKAGVKVCVLDTEGGVFKDIHEGFLKFVKNGFPEHVDLYCVWGQGQKKALLSEKVLDEKKIAVTGSPRYDMCALPWRGALEKHDIAGGKVVLVNMRFPTLFPKYVTDMVAEYDNTVKSGVNPSYMAEMLRHNMIACSSILEIISAAAGRLSDYTFVVRPHPFERKDVYQKFFADHQNIKVIQEGDIFGWLNSVDVVVQQGCTTGLEAKLMNVPVAEIAFDGDEVSSNINIKDILDAHVKSSEELIDFIKAPRITDFDRGPIQEWFYQLDGKASERIADTLDNFFTSYGNNISRIRLIKALSLKKISVVVCMKLLGGKLYNKTKSSLFKKTDGLGKSFTHHDVQKILNRIIDVDSNKRNSKVVKILHSFGIKIAAI